MSTFRLRWRRVTWATVAVCAGLVGAVVFVHWLREARELRLRLICAGNLKALGTSTRIYAEGAASPPSASNGAVSLEGVLGMLVTTGQATREQIVCPRSGKPYVFVVPSAGDGAEPNGVISIRTVIAYEPLWYHGGEGGNVLYADGHCSFERPETYADLFGTSGAGVIQP